MNRVENELFFVCNVTFLKVTENKVENPCLHLTVSAYLEQFPNFSILPHYYPHKPLFKHCNFLNNTFNFRNISSHYKHKTDYA